MNAAILRQIMLQGDEGQHSSEMTRVVKRSGYSASLNHPDEPLGYIKAYGITVSAVTHVSTVENTK